MKGGMTGRNAVVLLAALLSAALTARLGVWQLDRAAQKIALQASLDERRALPPLPAAELARDATHGAAQWHRRIAIEGTWLPAQTVFLDNRQMNARQGFYVLTPLKLADGSAVLVQRGWLPRHFDDRSAAAAPPLPAGPVQVEGRIAPAPSRLYDLGGASTGPIRQNLDLDAFSAEIGTPLRPLSIQQTAPATPGSDDGLKRDWPAPATGVDKHHGYAFQWFALSALITGLYVWFQLIRPRRRRQP